MLQMKLWDNELCPCCRQVPETNAMHILIYPHKSIKLVREKRFHDILELLRKEHTDPLLLQMIENFWFGEEYIIDSDSEQEYRRVYNIIKEIGVSQMWSGFIPRGMTSIQDNYFQSIGSLKTGKS